MIDTLYSDDEIKEARGRLWYMGNLEWKFDPTQKRMYEFWKGVTKKTTVINCSRRLGKSYFLTVIAIQQCLQHPKSIVKFLQPEQKMIRINIRPIMEKILEDCPAELRPSFSTKDNIYTFSNGSEIQLAGTDNGNHEKLRGGDSHLCIIDEAGFVKSRLQYIVRSVLLPTTFLTRGKLLLSSTSPLEADHDFAKYMEHAEQTNSLFRVTLLEALKDNEGIDEPRFTPELIEEIIAEYPGGMASDDFRRECLCEIIHDGDNAIIPEFNDELKQDIVKTWPLPTFYDSYVSMDVGFRDLTVVLFAYYDFQNAVVVIQDEIVTNGPSMTTESLAKSIQIKEKELWTNSLTQEFKPPYMRVSDNNLIVINDLQVLHGLTFLPTAKDGKSEAVNKARIMIGGYRVYIDPKCKVLIHHLKHGTWSKTKKTFSRSPDNGHYDAVDALVYLLRNINEGKNPYPRGYNHRHLNSGDGKFINNYGNENNKLHDQIKGWFAPKTNSRFNK
ncbi:MAG: hypothetical protein COB41_00305 [Proteobacteria bacterium]|nr:MAG: hypothetical protein COB41_00305 [Pseudomonadota bacterium]